MFSEDVLVERLCFVKLTHGLVETGQVVCCSNRYRIVVALVSLALLFAPGKRGLVESLQMTKTVPSLNGLTTVD